MNLSEHQKKYLRGLCHDLNPVVTLGNNGLTENVNHEIEIALEFHELIKVKIRADREERTAISQKIASKHQAVLVQSIGQVACYFKRNPDKPKIAMPG